MFLFKYVKNTFLWEKAKGRKTPFVIIFLLSLSLGQTS